MRFSIGDLRCVALVSERVCERCFATTVDAFSIVLYVQCLRCKKMHWTRQLDGLWALDVLRLVGRVRGGWDEPNDCTYLGLHFQHL